MTDTRPATSRESQFDLIAPYYDDLMAGVPYRLWVSYVEDILRRSTKGMGFTDRFHLRLLHLRHILPLTDIPPFCHCFFCKAAPASAPRPFSNEPIFLERQKPFRDMMPDTLDGGGPEELVVNLRAFDCVTFVENAVVLAGLIRSGKTAFADFTAALERIRYRRGRCDGYASRLHYFTDWMYDNSRKRLVRDITGEIREIPFRKTFHWLTDRREDYPGLKDPKAFRRMRIIEATCSRRPLFFIPKASLGEAVDRIADGDIIAMTTDFPAGANEGSKQ